MKESIVCMITQNTFMAENIIEIKGNIFNSKMQTLVNTVNCVGVMGKGIAQVYKLRYPQLLEEYQKHCYSTNKDERLVPGKLWIYKDKDSSLPWVLNFPTKNHWKYPSKLEWIELGLQKFVDKYQEKGITSIAFPLLGTTCGGLDKHIVLPLMKEYLSRCNIPVEIYMYDPTATDNLYNEFKKQWFLLPANLKEKQQITNLKPGQIQKISKALESNNVYSLTDLIQTTGIGEKTIQTCYKFVMANRPKQTEIFNL